ncbi:MAG: hypothetical protein JW867_04290 [Candidatus Omnitrophica bacterium]|nr:hypothetical protein [Candidatus Omnitrophota bacterium]
MNKKEYLFCFVFLLFMAGIFPVSQALSASKNGAEYGTWLEWFEYSGARQYIIETQPIDLLFKRHFALTSGLIERFSTGEDPDGSDEILTKMKSESQALALKLKSLSFPDEFDKYQVILLKICEIDQFVVDSLLQRSIEDAKSYHRELLLLIIASLKELKTIYTNHKASEDIIFDIDSVIFFYNQALSIS